MIPLQRPITPPPGRLPIKRDSFRLPPAQRPPAAPFVPVVPTLQ